MSVEKGERERKNLPTDPSLLQGRGTLAANSVPAGPAGPRGLTGSSANCSLGCSRPSDGLF